GRLGRTARLPAQCVDGPVADDAEGPAADRAAAAVVAGAAAPDREERLLGRVLRSGPVSEDPVGEGERRAAVAGVGELEGRRVLVTDKRHQVLVAEALDLVPGHGHAVKATGGRRKRITRPRVRRYCRPWRDPAPHACTRC